MSRILLFDKEKSTISILTNLLKLDGFRVDSLSRREQALELARTKEFSLLITTTDPEVDPELSVLRALRENNPSTPVIFLMPGPNAEQEARLKDLKAYAIMAKPLKVDELLASVQQAVDYYDVALNEVVDLNIQLEATSQFAGVVAASDVMKRVCEMVQRIAGADVSLLLVGEPGTGKSTLARMAHQKSRRSGRRIVTVDCGSSQAKDTLFGTAVKPSAFVEAEGGTLFLRNVGMLTRDLQGELRRVLSSRRIATGGGGPAAIDIRLVSSAAVDLEALVARDAFDAELARLLRVIVVRIPPLRERPQDILPVVRHVLRELLGPDKPLPALGPGVAQHFEEHTWPGNVNEIRTTLTAALPLASGGVIEKRHLAPPSSVVPIS